MAADCFSIGSIVTCTTCFQQSIEGEVLAFDQHTKVLILKRPSIDSTKLHDIFMMNLSLCSDVQVKQESNISPEPPKTLNLQRLTNRVKNAVEQKRRLVNALAAGVSPDGQKLYMVISKTITEINWSGQNIVVFNDVIIKPPYKVDNVCGSPNSRQLTYIKKIVEKFTNDQAMTASSSSSSTGPSSLSSNFNNNNISNNSNNTNSNNNNNNSSTSTVSAN